MRDHCSDRCIWHVYAVLSSEHSADRSMRCIRLPWFHEQENLFHELVNDLRRRSVLHYEQTVRVVPPFQLQFFRETRKMALCIDPEGRLLAQNLVRKLKSINEQCYIPKFGATKRRLKLFSLFWKVFLVICSTSHPGSLNVSHSNSWTIHQNEILQIWWFDSRKKEMLKASPS